MSLSRRSAIMLDDRSMRRRSPRRHPKDLTDDCTSLKQKDVWKSRSGQRRVLILAASLCFTVFAAGVLISSSHASELNPMVEEHSQRELRRSHYIGDPIAEWTMPSSKTIDIAKELHSLKWDKSSLSSMKEFIVQSKEILLKDLGDQHDLWKNLKSLHDNESPTAAVMLKNLPIDSYVPPTPTDGSNTLNKPSQVAEAVLLALGELSGAKVVGYSSEIQYSNPWVHEGFPRNGAGSALTAAHELSYHQDMSYQEHIPDILGLYCLREGHDKDVWTTLLDVREIIAGLSDDVVEILRQPRFRILTSEWVDGGWTGTGQGRPILSEYSLHLPVNWENMVGMDPKAKKALVELQDVILTTEPHRVHFEPGMLVLFNNQRMVHARTPYTDLRFDGGDRVVNRAYFRASLTSEEEKTRMI